MQNKVIQAETSINKVETGGQRAFPWPTTLSEAIDAWGEAGTLALVLRSYKIDCQNTVRDAIKVRAGVKVSRTGGEATPEYDEV